MCVGVCTQYCKEIRDHLLLITENTKRFEGRNQPGPVYESRILGSPSTYHLLPNENIDGEYTVCLLPM